ncbi:helix-turn-helix domain-containing protein [Pedobacter frigidisoli]|uniref:Helix-turn-helix domain-containing protein n=1 Tax=Pedobacter frigidisoli TaxID=2530455 RepID=A0A4R0P3F7_9SPHI|nr:helix-turn-helix domain-containing protein [Pedobacter frigidisoli]TCD07704.1 helix-turn-helix domain-containing protein [Pedobacter frigidisoli]
MQFLNFLVSTTCFFLLLFALHLSFSKNGDKRQNILLSVLFFTRCGQILTSVMISSSQQNGLSVLFQSFTPLYFAAPAGFYLYIVGFLHQHKSIKRTELLHFIPALVAFVHVIPWPGLPPLDWTAISEQMAQNGYHSLSSRSGLFPAYFHYLFRPILTLSYLILSWIAVIRSRIIPQGKNEDPSRNWLLFLVLVASFFQLMGLLPILLRSIHLPVQNSYLITLNCLALLGIMIYALHRPHIFYGFLLIAIDWKKGERQEVIVISQEEVNLERSIPPMLPSMPARKVSLSETQLEVYANLLKELMERERPYLAIDLQIIDLAKKINIPVHHCSFVINNHIGKNFRDWINGYRINHFLIQYPLLADRLTIEAIAQEAGFKSPATFYNAFKKETGLMPTQYFSREMDV